MPKRILLLLLPLLAAIASPAEAGLRAVPGADSAKCRGFQRKLETLASVDGSLDQFGSVHTPFIVQFLRRALDIARTDLHDCVRLNQIQVIGTHNSYHKRPKQPYFNRLARFSRELRNAWDYEHLPLDQQFETQGIRQIEIDVYADPDGGLYANRLGPALAGLPEMSPSNLPELELPGFKVLHVQDLDFESTCFTLRACLETVVAWSDAHPAHLPIVILLELKDERVDPDFGFVVPVPFDATQMDALDAEIRDAVPAEKLVTPDDVRRSRATLEDAVLGDGWPTLGQLRGRVMFVMDNSGEKHDVYVDGRPSAEGRVIFPNSTPGSPDGAFVKLNDPLHDPIAETVSAGYLVRTRSDGDTVEARADDTGPRDAALASGAQFVSTDYPVPDPVIGTGYFVALPEGPPARCNPVTGPRGCASRFLERLDARRP